MAAMKDLDTVLATLAEYSQGIMETVQALREMLSGEVKAPPLKEHTEEQPEKHSERETPEKQPPKIEDVRALLLEKRKAGFRDEIKALLLRHGAEKLTEVAPTEYEALMAEAEGIGT